jgi:gamma-glutamyltranspeptidase / glutathione hydrolase
MEAEPRMQPRPKMGAEPMRHPARNAVVSPHFLSAEAARHILLSGGNAIDAAVAMVAAQGVVAPETCGLGGDLFALVHSPGWDKPRALNSSGRAGSKADPQVLRDLGHTRIPGDHPYTATIPGCVDGLTTLAAELGALDLKTNLEPAITLATEGFPVSNEQSRAFTAMTDVYRENPAVTDFYPHGEAVNPGQVVRRADLARTLGLIADGGREGFFKGQPGADILSVLGDHVAAEDLDQSIAEWVEPLACPIERDTAWTIPPNSAGYLGPATLAVFLMLDPPSDPRDPMWWHLMIESHRALAWERDRLVADPGYVEIPPAELVSEERLGRAADSIDRTRAGQWPTPPAKPTGTAYMCVTDASGLSVSIIQSNYSGTGSPFGAANSGFLLHNRGAGFSLEPGHPNELGPRKRPAHTLSPTIWTRGTETSWLLGTRGGEIQPQLIAQLAARAIVAGWELTGAQVEPRWSMTEYGPGSTSAVSIEPGSGVVSDLRRFGHDVVEKEAPQPGWGPMSIIDRRDVNVLAASDPRVDTAMALVF